MKQRLLSLMALACAMFTSTSALAQWSEPEEVAPAFTNEAVAPEDGGVYFLFNEATNLYLGAGNNWGTHVVATNLSSDPEILPTFWDQSIGLSGSGSDQGKGTALAMQVTKLESGNWYIEHLGTNRANRYLSSEDGNSWIDCDNARRIDFIFTAVEGGYTIQASNTVEAKTYFGIVDGDVTPTDEVPVISLDVMNNIASGERAVWKFLKTNYTQWKAYKARVSMYEFYQEIETSEYTVDLSAEKEIYDKADATIEELEDALTQMRVAFNKAKYQSLFDGASDDNPMDVTDYVLTNPTFDSNINGWTITVTGQNLQWQGRTDGVVNESKNWVSITNFIEAWRDSNNGPLGDGTISQTVYSLPAGKYLLECDAMATRQGGLDGKSEEEAVEGAYIFIQGESAEVREPIKAPNGQPKHWKVIFISYGDDALTFGLKVENTTANWISADNFRLIYFGETTKTQAQLELEAVIEQATEYQEQIGDQFCYESAKTDFATALKNAEDAIDISDEACLAAKQVLEEKMAAVASSIEAYKVLLSYLDRTGGKNLLGQYYDIADGCGMTELTEKWESWRDSWDQAYEEGTMTDADIYEKTGSMYSDLKAAWLNVDPTGIKTGTDLTWLIENADFEEGDVYTAGSGGSIPGWTIAEGDITRKDHVIEAYHRVLDFNQVLPNMPAGVYDVTLQGFVRHDGSATNETIFYAGDSQATLMQRSDQWNATGFYLDDSQGDPCGGANKDQEITNSKSETVKVPNGMSGFYYWEDEENTNGGSMDYPGWKAGDKYYTNHVKVILKEAGDFTIGLKSLGSTDWIIWDNFGLTYLGQDASLYDDMIAEKYKSLDAVYDADKIFITEEGKKKVEDLEQEIDDKKGTLNADTEAALEQEIDDVIAYLNEGHNLAIGLISDLSDYDEIRLQNGELMSPDENAFVDWVTALVNELPSDDYGMLPNTDELKSNEALQATIIDMNRRMGEYVIQFAAENPYKEEDGTLYGNATEAIFNPRYIGYSSTGQTDRGWTLEVADSIKGKAIGLGANNAEMFNCSNFKISQTVRGLYPGWYLLTVDGFYRPGDYATIKTFEDTQKQYVVMFAESGDLKSEKPLKNIMAGAQSIPTATQDEVDITINEQKYYIPNRMGSAATYMQLEVPVKVIKEEGKPDKEIYNDIAIHFDEFDGSYNSIYRNGMLVEVDESGEMTIGLRKDDNWVPNDWTIFGNWTLTYFGEEENIPTAVETVEAKSAKNMIQDIYTIDGRQTQRLQRGINIVRTADGKLHKVLVK